MPNITIEGMSPLRGTVKVSGAKNSAVKLIFASMHSNDDVILENIPRVKAVDTALEIVRSVGGTANWVGANRLLLNGSTISTFEIPLFPGGTSRKSYLLAGPLLNRFGSARIPKLKHEHRVIEPVNRLIDTWRSLDIDISEEDQYLLLKVEGKTGGHVNFKVSTHIGTDNAILSSVFLQGETVISNASEETEIEDLIGLMCAMGVNVERVEPRKIKVEGTDVFRGARFSVQSDKTEIATFSTAAILTRGDVIIRDVERTAVISFLNFLTKIGAKYDFSNKELRVWSGGEILNPMDVTISPAPGFIPDWQPLATLLLTQANGTSTLHDTVYINRFDYIKDLNRMGARIERTKPSEKGLMPVISDDSYDFEQMGEPSTLLKIEGPTRLKSTKIHIMDYRFEYVLILAALTADGKSQITDELNVDANFENFVDKLHNLGAKIWS